MTIANNSVVSIHYTLTNAEGEVIDSSESKEPLSYLHGAQNIIPGLENALTGKAVGDEIDVVVQPADGYGEKDEALMQAVPRSAFEGVDKIEPGMTFHTEAEGNQISVTVVSASEDEVVVDRNHPLAGVELHFAVNIVNIREASAEEIDHGHTH